MLICGLDEAGRGPLAGPVVTAAVVLDNQFLIEGIKDSKQLAASKREYLFEEIVRHALWWDVAIIQNDIIDKITAATMLGFQKNLQKLNLTGVELLVDGNYFKLPKMERLKFPYKTIVAGDRLIYQISAASIVAKVTRDRIMEEYHFKYPLYGFNKHKGYPTKQHIDNIKRFGICDIHRRTFCNKYVQKINDQY